MFKTLLLSHIKSPKNMCFDGEDDDEVILYLLRRSFITNFDWIFITLLMLITPAIVAVIVNFWDPALIAAFPVRYAVILQLFWYLFIFGWVFQNFINWFFNVYIITNKRLVDLDFVGFLYKNISEAPLESVEDVTSNVKGALRIIFNYGDVYIQTAAEQREFDFSDVWKPSQVRDIISDLVTEKKNAK